MAYRWIGRDGDYKHKSTYTSETDDEKDDFETSFSPVTKQPLETPTSTAEETTELERLTDFYLTPTQSYSLAMSVDQQGGPGKSFGPPTARPTVFSWWQTDGDDNHQGPQTSTTLVTSQSQLADLNQQSTPALTTPTVIPTGDTSSPEPSNYGYPGLQNNGADHGPNRTPMYAAAGVTPIVVIIIAFSMFCCLRKRRRQRRAAAEHGHIEEMKMHPKPVTMPYIAPITPPSPPPAVLPQYSPSTPSSSYPPTASSSQPVILGPITSGNNGAYLTGMDTSDIVSMRSASNISRVGTVVDRDPFADGRSLEEAPPPYRPSSLPPASLVSTSRNSSVRIAAPPQMTSRTQLVERSPFDDPEDDDVSEMSVPTIGRHADAMSDISDLSYQIDPVVGRSPF